MTGDFPTLEFALLGVIFVILSLGGLRPLKATGLLDALRPTTLWDEAPKPPPKPPTITVEKATVEEAKRISAAFIDRLERSIIFANEGDDSRPMGHAKSFSPPPSIPQEELDRQIEQSLAELQKPIVLDPPHVEYWRAQTRAKFWKVAFGELPLPPWLDPHREYFQPPRPGYQPPPTPTPPSSPGTTANTDPPPAKP